MHKIETTSAGLTALAIITLVSPSLHAAIGLSMDNANKKVGDLWEEDVTHRKQFIAFHGEDGPAELSGVVLESEVVEVQGAAFKVVAEVRISTKAMPAFKAGGIPRSLMAVELSRVLEVWTAPQKCVYKVEESPKATKAMTDGGKIVAA